jgi:enoyl-[acyl-carrier protein] reductase II
MMGIKYPILLGGMLFVGKAKLVAAVSNAGGLGILGGGAMGSEELREEIREIRSLTERPFGINIPVRSPRAEALVQGVFEEGVKIVSTSAGDPFQFTKPLKQRGVIVIHVVPTVAHARRAQDAGVDAIVAEGSESGGYINLEEVTTMALVPQVVDVVKLPVIAAGGIADARGLVAALALGAVGVQMGTRFLATKECEIPDDYKKALLLARDTDTVVVRGKITAHRDLKKELIAKVQESEGVPLVSVEEMVSQFEREGVREFPKDGIRWAGRSAGQSAGLIHEILPVEKVIGRMMAEAQALMTSLTKKLGLAHLEAGHQRNSESNE